MRLITFRGQTPQLGRAVMIDPMAFVLGEVKLGDDVSVWPGAIIRGDMHRIEVGARTSVQDGAVLHITHASPHNPAGHPLVIGEDVTIGHQACLHGCTIGHRVLIGMGAIVLDGAVLEDDVMLGAGALVPPGKRLASGFLYVGAPAQQARPLNAQERALLLHSANNYVSLKDEYLAAQIDQRAHP